MLLAANEVRMQIPSFEEFADFVRGFAGVRQKEPITRAMKFEDDLDIIGDDGDDLLEKVQHHFEVEFTRETFNLQPHEVLFHDEADVLWLGSQAQSLLSLELERHMRIFRAFTVGELYDAVVKELAKSSQPPDA
jgi:hypothetical protein